jgi:hypothetical protein
MTNKKKHPFIVTYSPTKLHFLAAFQDDLNMLSSTLYHYLTSHISHGRRGRDRIVVGFTTTYAISVYNH